MKNEKHWYNLTLEEQGRVIGEDGGDMREDGINGHIS